MVCEKPGGAFGSVLGDFQVISCNKVKRSSPAKWAFLGGSKPGGETGGVEGPAAGTSHPRTH